MFRDDSILVHDILGKVYAFTRWRRPVSDDIQTRDVFGEDRAYARQTLRSIAQFQDEDPFNYRLYDVWQMVFQKPWTRPATLDDLIDDLAEAAHNGDLFAYMEYSQAHALMTASSGPGGGAGASDGGDVDGRVDEPRSQSHQPGGGNSSAENKAGLDTGAVAALAAAAALPLAARRGLAPTSLDDAVARLASMKEEIRQNGYQPKYSDEELYQMAREGGTLDDRYIVRFSPMPRDAQGNEIDPATNQGPIAHQRESGRHPLWTTTFDQIEAADTDAELIAMIMGTRYDTAKNYVLYIMDRGENSAVDGGDVFVPTFSTMKKKLKTEFVDDLDPDVIDAVMDDEYAEQFRNDWASFNDYVADRDLHWTETFSETRAKQFVKNNPGMDSHEQEKFLARHRILAEIGAFEQFTGDGLTERQDIMGRPGVLETLEIQHQPASSKELFENGSMKYVQL